MNHHFNWEEEARKILLSVRDWGQGLAKQEFDDGPLPGMSPDQALTALSQAFKQAVDAAEPEKKFVRQGLMSTFENMNESRNEGFNQATAEYKSNLNNLIDGGTD